MKIVKCILLIIPILIAPKCFAGNGAWELEKNENGIKVYTRTVEGEDIREFKATTTITASRKKIASIIVNINDYVNWFPDISEAKMLEKVGEGKYHIYNVLDLPWPAADRDGVTLMTISKSEGKTIIKLKSVEGVVAEKSDYVRIPKSYGFWQLKTVGNKTTVQFQYFANPGGSLPDWVINMFIVDNPFDALTNLKKRATA